MESNKGMQMRMGRQQNTMRREGMLVMGKQNGMVSV